MHLQPMALYSLTMFTMVILEFATVTPIAPSAELSVQLLSQTRHIGHAISRFCFVIYSQQKIHI